MLTIYTQNKFLAEKQYSFNILLTHLLGIEFSIDFHEKPEYRLELSEKKSIIFADAFWSRLSENEQYFNTKNIPKSIQTFSSPNNSYDLISIFQNQEITYSENDKTTKIPVDIFASAFFMLSRWEEFAIKTRDKFGRFPDYQSLAQRENFHHRPVVNEYAEFLWEELKKTGCRQTKKTWQYSLKLTHDIDFGFRYDTPKKRLKALAGDILKRHSIKQFFNTLSDIKAIKQKTIKDTYDTFDFLMDIAEENNLKAHFYFIAGKQGETDIQYNIDDTNITATIDNIKKRQHHIGIHGSWDSFDNSTQLKIEKRRLQDIINEPITENRQHFLRFSVPQTWQTLENLEIKKDSTMGYSNATGFRCGICHPFPVFNILTQETLNLIEYPLIIMDTAAQRETRTPELFEQKIIEIANVAKLFNGTLTLLWHPNNFYTIEWNVFARNYRSLIKTLATPHKS